jgi:hypothetical protein
MEVRDVELSWTALTADGPRPKPGEVVLVRLKGHKCGTNVTESTFGVKTLAVMVVPAILDSVKDGFGVLHPHQWILLGARWDGPTYEPTVDARVPLHDVDGFCKFHEEIPF